MWPWCTDAAGWLLLNDAIPRTLVRITWRYHGEQRSEAESSLGVVFADLSEDQQNNGLSFSNFLLTTLEASEQLYTRGLLEEAGQLLFEQTNRLVWATEQQVARRTKRLIEYQPDTQSRDPYQMLTAEHLEDVMEGLQPFLSDREQHILAWRGTEVELAQTLGITVGTLRVVRHRLHKKVQHILLNR